jgi:hypothetical protein
MDRLRQAARAALDTIDAPAAPEARLDRLSAELELHGSHELLSLRLEADGLRWKCSCGQARCSHAATLLSLLAGGPASGTEAGPAAQPPTPRGSLAPERRVVAHSERTPHLEPGALQRQRSAIAESLRDVVTAVVRGGVRADASASTDEALERLIATAPEPLPNGVSRWVGRLREGLARGEVVTVSRLLDGASSLAVDLRASEPEPDAAQRTLSFLGAMAHDPHDVDRLTERSMLEVAREWVSGVDRASLERRYLLDLDSGEVYREERARSANGASLGPCPRVVQVAYAEVERAAPPRRIRLLQYSSSPVVPDAVWDQLRTWSTRDFALLGARFRESARRFAGLAEPFAMVLPFELEREPAPLLLDDARHQLPLFDAEDGVLRHLQDHPGTPSWFAGRLVEQRGVIMLRPLSCAFGADGRFGFERI